MNVTSSGPGLLKRTLLLSLCSGLILSLFVFLLSPFILESFDVFIVVPGAPKVSTPSPAKIIQETAALAKSVASLKTRYGKMTPADPYLIVNSADNVFVLKKGDTVIRKGLCSTGSYIMLKSQGMREWIFQTPRGLYRILNKKEEPVWHKPDWAFVEEGKVAPPAGSPERNEYGVLGDYALSLGQGYMIHGTLYQRFLGLPVSHGCVRLGDDDLELIYKSLRVGSKVFLF